MGEIALPLDTGQVSLATSAEAIVLSNDNRESVVVFNAGAGTVYVGNSSVSVSTVVVRRGGPQHIRLETRHVSY
jgi:hypothetical protein